MFCAVAFGQRLLSQSRTRATGFCLAAIAVGTAVGCGNGSKLVLTEQVEARRLASSLRVQFSKAADASNRAVMAVTDEASTAAARESEQATKAVERDVEALQRILQALAYRDDIRHLEAFKACFVGYRSLDADILPLAVENTNIKAQRLSFGPARDTANAFRQSLEAAGRSNTTKTTCCVDALIAKAAAAVLDVQVIQARHIAESDDTAMSRMEAEMSASEAAARNAVDALKGLLPSAAGPQLAEAAAALDRFKTINAELVTLSRRNSNVRSLALSLGRKRTVTAECDDVLHALEEALAKHDFTATR
jgi:negative regulator of replication initiation